MEYSILLIEDDVALHRALSFDLKKEGYHVTSLYLGYDALALDLTTYALLILDINLPDISGFALIKEIKARRANLPIMYLSACDLDQDILHGYDLGADEYITKPFHMKILHHKINIIIKRNHQNNHPYLYQDEYLMFDKSTYVLTKNQVEVSLTPVETKLLCYFMEHPQQVLTRETIICYLWDSNNNYVDEHTLTVNIKRLRNKIETKEHPYIKTVYGIGYMWIGKHDE